MSRDLYGEVLANVLNRKAPQNHFAAYINPDEAAMLRSQGGGVAPGGGQYMANGLPAFIEDVGAQAWGGSDLGGGSWGGLGDGGSVDAAALAEALQDNRSWEQAVQDITVANMANELDPNVGLSQGVNPFGTAEQRSDLSMPSVDSAAVADMLQALEREDDARLGMAIANVTPTVSSVSTVAPSTNSQPQYDPAAEAISTDAVPYGAIEMQAMNKVALDQISIHEKAKADAEALKNSQDYTTRQERNLKAMLTDPFWDTKTDEERQSLLDRPISEYGIGKFAPGGIVAGQGASADVIAHVMTPSASGGYAVNDPSRPDVSVPKGYNMGFFPAAMTSLIGSASPLASLMAMPGYGLTDYAVDLAKEDEGFIGGAYNTFANMRDKMADAFSPVTNAFGDLTGTVRDGVVDFGGGLGDALSNFDSPFPDFGPSRPEVDTMGQSAADPGPDIEPINGFVNVADDSFSVTDGVVENPGEKEKEYSPIPPDILARILANVQYGRERQRIAREMG